MQNSELGQTEGFVRNPPTPLFQNAEALDRYMASELKKITDSIAVVAFVFDGSGEVAYLWTNQFEYAVHVIVPERDYISNRGYMSLKPESYRPMVSQAVNIVTALTDQMPTLHVFQKTFKEILEAEKNHSP